MKKVLFVFAIALATTLVACGGNASTEAKTDSTAVSADTTKVDSAATPAVDTTVAK